MSIYVLSALQLGVCRVPVRNAHVDADGNGFECFQAMALQDGHDLVESRQFVIHGEEGPCILPDIFRRFYGLLVRGHPVEHGENDLADSGDVYILIGLQAQQIMHIST